MNYFNVGGYGMRGSFLSGFILLMLWSLFWKGLALWHAAKRHEKKWFIAILVINTLGILEIIYLFHFVKIRFDKLWRSDFFK